MDKIESAGASILWNLSDEDNVNNTFEWCLEKKRVDIVVSLDNDKMCIRDRYLGMNANAQYIAIGVVIFVAISLDIRKYIARK